MRRNRAASANEPVVVGVSPYPEPEHAIGQVHAHRTMVQAHADGPEPMDLLEME